MRFYINYKSFSSMWLFVMGVVLIILCRNNITTATTSNSELDITDYLGQPEPGDIPLVFAPRHISKEDSDEYPCCFSSDMTEMYFGRNMGNGQRDTFVVEKQTDGRWSSPRKICLTGYPEAEPMLSPDGSRLFVAAHSDRSKWKPHDLWYVDRSPDGWGKPIRLNDQVNSDAYEYFVTATTNHRIYFTREGQGIYCADWRDNMYQNVQFTGLRGGHPYISPDERYLMFDSRQYDGRGSADLYISFRENNTWTTPVNLGDKINTSQWDAMPVVSPDGRFLFFCRGQKNGVNRDIYWVKFDLNRYNKVKEDMP